jgi:hypothetical protein
VKLDRLPSQPSPAEPINKESITQHFSVKSERQLIGVHAPSSLPTIPECVSGEAKKDENSKTTSPSKILIPALDNFDSAAVANKPPLSTWT